MILQTRNGFMAPALRRIPASPGASTLCWMLAVLAALTLLPSCQLNKRLNRRLSLRQNDDNPYGAQIAFDALNFIFPDADISVNKERQTAIPTSDAKSARVILTDYMYAEAADVTMLMNFVGEGNFVFISANQFSDTLLKNFQLHATNTWQFAQEPDSLTVGVYDPVSAEYNSFTYPGDSYDNYVTRLDTQYVTVLGRDAHGRPDFVRMNYKGGGAVFLHFAPLAFSNFFLLHKQNMAYYEKALSYLPSTIKRVTWDESFRYAHNGGKPFSTLSFIGKSPALSWGLALLLLLLIIIYLFDSKRRQRQIPVIPPLSNTSLDFVRTIGRLYYQRRDNHNLASKMVMHFQDQVRTRYHLAGTSLEEGFADRLAYRTGYPKQEMEELVEYMQQLPSKAFVSDEELMDFYRQLEAFYKHT
jgi:hypothetical protein